MPAVSDNPLPHRGAYAGRGAVWESHSGFPLLSYAVERAPSIPDCFGTGRTDTSCRRGLLVGAPTDDPPPPTGGEVKCCPRFGGCC